MNILKGIGLILIFLFGVLIQPILWLIAFFIPKDESVYYHSVRRFVHHECGCDSNWHDSFFSQADFEELDRKILNQFNPVGHTEWYSPKPKVKFMFYEYGAENAEAGFIYECKSCNRLAELSVPENAYRGCFKGINLDKDEIKKYLKDKN